MNRPTLILLIGPCGCGKTTYAQKYIEQHINTLHFSSDKVREELWGDESIQENNNDVFKLMQSRTVEALNNGYNVIYDCTNMTRQDRSCIISVCPKFTKIESHIIFTPIETCIERDAARKRTVGKAVIDKMLKRFQPPFYDEGFDEIKIIKPEDFNKSRYVMEIFESMNIPHDNPHHTLSIHGHCNTASDLAIERGLDVDLQMAALIHDIGKPYVKAFVDSKGNSSETAHFYSHDSVGAWMSYGVNGCTPHIAWLVGNHMGPFMNTKYYNKLPSFLKNQIDLLHECDLNAH